MVEAYRLEIVLFYSSIPFLVIGLIGNVLVIRIVHMTREMHTPTNYLLVSMAVSDVIIILLWPVYFFESTKFGCKFSAIISGVCITSSSITLTLLAVERYHALLKPFRTGLRLSKANVKKAITFIWIASFLVSLPEFSFIKWNKGYPNCLVHMNHARKDYVIIKATLFYIQLAIMGYCYGSLIRGLYFTNTVCQDTDGERGKEKKKLVITFIMATVGFFIGYVPGVIFYTVIASEDGNQISFSNHLSVSIIVFHCSLCLNPIIYAFRSTNFQEGFKRILLCCKPASQNDIQLR